MIGNKDLLQQEKTEKLFDHGFARMKTDQGGKPTLMLIRDDRSEFGLFAGQGMLKVAVPEGRHIIAQHAGEAGVLGSRIV